MLENDRIETESTEVTSIRRRNDMEKNPLGELIEYFVDFESRIYVGICTSDRCPNFHAILSFKIGVISTNLPRGISMSNRWRLVKDVSIG